MPTSGVEVPDQCVSDFSEMKLKHNRRCMIFVIKDDREFYIYKHVDKGKDGKDQKAEFDDIVAELKSDPCLLGCDSDTASASTRNPCVMVMDLNVESEGKANKDVLLFMKVCPDEGISIKKKMVLSSSVEVLKGKLDGITKRLDISSIDELTYERVLEAMK